MDQSLVAWIGHNSMGDASASNRSVSIEGSVVTTVTASVGTSHYRAECVISNIIILFCGNVHLSVLFLASSLQCFET